MRGGRLPMTRLLARAAVAWVLVSGCSPGAMSAPDGAAAQPDGAAPTHDLSTLSNDGSTLSNDGGSTGGGIAARYPGDVGIASDPDVIFADDFESYTQTSDLN